MFRVLDRDALDRLQQSASVECARDEAFLDRGEWSLAAPSGPNYVVIDGSAFFIDASWMYDSHHELEAPFAEAERTTRIVPRAVVARWRRDLDRLPADGEVARHAPHIRDALLGLMDAVLDHDRLTLTVASLL